MSVLRSVVMASLIALTALLVHGARAQDGSEAMNMPGAHVVLSLDAAELRANWLNSMREEIRNRLREAKVGFSGLTVADKVVQVRLAKPEDTEAALNALADLVRNGVVERVLETQRGSPESDVAVAKGEANLISVMATEFGLERRTSTALDDAVAIVGRRLDGFKVAARAVRLRHRIYVHAPTLQDTSALKDLLTKPARLGFHEMHASLKAEQAREVRVPAGFKIYPVPGQSRGEVLREAPIVRGNDLVDAQAAFDQRTSEPIIAFRLNATGTRALGRFTTENIGRPFAIVLDDVVLSAPLIREPILGGVGQVSGNFTSKDAALLAVQLRAGALPAKLVLVEDRMVPHAR